MKTIISNKDTKAFLLILENEKPSEKLRKSAEKYKELIFSNVLIVKEGYGDLV